MVVARTFSSAARGPEYGLAKIGAAGFVDHDVTCCVVFRSVAALVMEAETDDECVGIKFGELDRRDGWVRNG